MDLSRRDCGRTQVPVVIELCDEEISAFIFFVKPLRALPNELSIETNQTACLELLAGSCHHGRSRLCSHRGARQGFEEETEILSRLERVPRGAGLLAARGWVRRIQCMKLLRCQSQ